MPSARNSAALKRPAWMKGVVNSVTFTMNRFARRAVLIRSPTVNNNCVVTLEDIATFNALNNRWELDENYTLPSNCTLTINENEILLINNGKSLTNNGEIIINNSGKIIIFSCCTFNNNGKINNSGSIEVNGPLNNSGTIINNGILTNESGIINNSGVIINNISGEIFSDFTTNKIINSGTIENKGEITNEGEINNSGTITNSGKIFNQVVFSNANIFNQSGGTIINEDTIINDGKIYVYDGGLLDNIIGTITNNNNIVVADGTSTCGTGVITGESNITGPGTVVAGCPP